MEVKTYTQTLEFLRSYIEPVASTAEKAISEALGFVLAEDLHSPIDLPLFNNSATVSYTHLTLPTKLEV